MNNIGQEKLFKAINGKYSGRKKWSKAFQAKSGQEFGGGVAEPILTVTRDFRRVLWTKWSYVLF